MKQLNNVSMAAESRTKKQQPPHVLDSARTDNTPITFIKFSTLDSHYKINSIMVFIL